MKIYIAGPMTGLPDLNRPAFNEASAQLKALGHQPVNPASLRLFKNATWQDHMRATTVMLAGCHGVALLPGWERSAGAKIERRWAESVGLQVLLLDQWKAARK